MELEALLLSNKLLVDVVVGPIYKHLCSIKKPLSSSLTEAILHHHFYLIKLLLSYHINKQYSRSFRSSDYYLYWLENDLVYYLNDKIMLLNGLSNNLLERFPDVTIEFMCRKVEVVDLPKRIYTLWKMMDNEQRIDSCKNLIHQNQTETI
jgi:hypothetical protein